MGLTKAYLVLYNLTQSAGWTYTLCMLIQCLANSDPPRVVYETVTPSLRLCQVLSFLEVVHAATGMVRTGFASALTQWFARTHCLVAVLDSVVEVQGEPWVAVMYAAWALTEVVRYPWYAFSLMGACPSWLTWLRYTVFIPTYPFGVVSEILILYGALPYAKERQMYNLNMPNALNFSFDWHKFMIGGLCYYPFAWLQLYMHMFAQRKKKLSPPKKQE